MGNGALYVEDEQRKKVHIIKVSHQDWFLTTKFDEYIASFCTWNIRTNELFFILIPNEVLE